MVKASVLEIWGIVDYYYSDRNYIRKVKASVMEIWGFATF
jgi:hypothetical protein